MKKIIGLFDKVAGMFLQPMFVPSVGVAYRGLQDEAAKGGEGNVLALHTKDFVVYEYGSFDEDSGVLETFDVPVRLCELADIISQGE